MNVGIITLRLRENYGGLLQNYALQKVIDSFGFNAVTVKYKNKRAPLYNRLATNVFLRAILKYVLHRKIDLYARDLHKYNLDKHQYRFIRENIKLTDLIFSPAKMEDFLKYNFGAFVVGSDQIWRGDMAPYLPTSFLDFIPDSSPIKRIAYAVSFGVDKFIPAYLPVESFRKLAKKFNAISVREDTGIKICAEVLGVKAEHTLDPTMLLEPSDYEKIIKSDLRRGYFTEPQRDYCLAYFLDNRKSILSSNALAEIGVEIFDILPKGNHNALRLNVENCTRRPVSEWLYRIKHAKFVVTDSFHGVVFSILFNTPFAVVKNRRRGIPRISSLLKMFNLESRIVDVLNSAIITKTLNTPIDWTIVNETLNKRRISSKTFLRNALER